MARMAWDTRAFSLTMRTFNMLPPEMTNLLSTLPYIMHVSVPRKAQIPIRVLSPSGGSGRESGGRPELWVRVEFGSGVRPRAGDEGLPGRHLDALDALGKGIAREGD